jgi:DNA-binding FrmR family transcriptional regulator
MPKASLMTTKYLAEEDKHAILGRLNRACGQINAVRKMVEQSECVDALLIQISAAKAALTQVALELMEKHLVNCAET